MSCEVGEEFLSLIIFKIGGLNWQNPMLDLVQMPHSSCTDSSSKTAENSSCVQLKVSMSLRVFPPCREEQFWPSKGGNPFKYR